MSTRETWVVFLSGVLCAGYGVATLYFLKFWTKARDRLFLYFAAAFGLLTLQRAALTVPYASSDDEIWFYLVRLFAFGLILAGIIDKNRDV